MKHANVSQHTGQKVGIDGFNLLYLFKERKEDLEAYLRGLLDLQMKLIVYMDSRAAKEKEEVVEKRKEAREDAKGKAESLEKFTKSEEFKQLDLKQQEVFQKKLEQTVAKAWSLNSKHTKWFKKLCADLKIDLRWAEQEADEALARGGFDIVITTDSDLLILKVKTLWIPRGIGLQHNEILYQDFLHHIGLREDQLYELAFLAGCDVYPRSIKPFGEAVSWLRFYGSLAAVHKKKPTILTAKHLQEYARLQATVWAPPPVPMDVQNMQP
jgi:hypothetical protein